jgi:hypothetical protein
MWGLVLTGPCSITKGDVMALRILPALGLVLSLAPAAVASTPAPSPASSGDAVRVGSPITARKPTEIKSLAKDPKRYVGQTLRIEGTVAKVCQGAGCWVEVASSGGQKFLAKSLDESVLLPKDCAGRKITVQGVVTMIQPKDAAAHQHAEPVGEAHECPAPTYLLATQGAELAATKKR